jgi:flagellin
MSTINTNVQSMIAQRVLGNNTDQLNKQLERLSTGLRINSGKDDPAGLIASENLRSEEKSLQAAIGNAERADQVMNIAEGGLKEVNSLLLEMQSLVTESANDAGLSEEEKQANQLQVDSILQSIDRISQTTSFQGTKLLNGSLDYTLSSQSSNVVEAQVNGAKLNHGETRDVQVTVTNSAQHAGLFLSTGGSLDLSANGSTTAPDQRFVMEVAGSKGSREFSFASGTATSAMAAQINTYSDVLGVSAAASSGGSSGSSGVMLKSTEFGSDQFVSVDIVDDGNQQAGSIQQLSATNEDVIDTGGGATTKLSAVTNPVRDDGQDVEATVNGVTATADGKKVELNTAFLDIETTLDQSGAQNLQTIDAFTITGGGAKFNVGPDVNITNQVSTGLQSVSSRSLGTNDTGFLDELASSKSANVVDGDLNKAQKIVDQAIKQVSQLRGRIGAFQKNTLQPTINNLNVTMENTAAAESSIRDTDFAETTAELTRSQILQSSAQNTLSIANSQPRNVLSLLGGGG